jgi:dolichol-phosphate mannosyltransferase
MEKRIESKIVNKMKLSIIIPAYLEAENLQIILPKLKEVLNDLVLTHEVMVIDTVKSMDNTKDVCLSNEVIYINRLKGNKYGDAVRTGIKYAKGEYILFMDADGSHSPEFIPKLYALKDHNDVVIASRYMEGGNTDNGIISKLMSRTVNIIFSIVLGLNCKDVSNSFKLYRAELLKKLNLNSSNFDIIEEILFKLKRINPNLKMKEIPFYFKERVKGQSKRNLFLFAISYIYTLIKLRFGK